MTASLPTIESTGGRVVWFEAHDRMEAAIQREKSIKRYLRQWKINLIEQENPHWVDLYGTLNR